MKHPFDEPTEKSLLEAKDYWEDQLEMDREFLKEEDLTEEDKEGTLGSIATAEENLKGIDARLTQEQHKEYWEGKKKLGKEFLCIAETEKEKQKFLKDIAVAEEKLETL